MIEEQNLAKRLREGLCLNLNCGMYPNCPCGDGLKCAVYIEALEARMKTIRNATLDEAAIVARIATLSLQLSQDEANTIEASIRVLATPVMKKEEEKWI